MKKTTLLFLSILLLGATLGGPRPRIEISEMAPGTDGELFTYDSGGLPTTFGPGTANQYIASQGAGAEPIFKSILDEDDMTSDSATDVASQQSIKKYVDDNSGLPARGFWVLPQSSSIESNLTTNSWRSVNLNSVSSAFANFRMPNNFVSLVSVEMIIIAEDTNTAQWDEFLSFGAPGEVNSANDASSLNETQAITDTEIEALDVSAVFGGSGIAAGDIVSLRIKSDFSSLRVVGFWVQY